jgi:hypothetical protein
MPNIAKPVVCHCSKRFKDSQAHAQHLRDLPNHPPEITPEALVVDPAPAGAPVPFYMFSYSPALNTTIVTSGIVCSCGKIVSDYSGLNAHLQLETHQTNLRKFAIATVKEKVDKRSQNVLEQNSSHTTPPTQHTTPRKSAIAMGREEVTKFSANLAEQSESRAIAASGSWTAQLPYAARSIQPIQLHATPPTPHSNPRKPAISKAEKNTTKRSKHLHEQSGSQSQATAASIFKKAKQPHTAGTTQAKCPASIPKPNTAPRETQVAAASGSTPATQHCTTTTTQPTPHPAPPPQPHKTPLDRFFASFPAFTYDRSLPPATSYALLKAHRGWRKSDPPDSEGKRAWKRYQSALLKEVQIWFGKEDDLEAWCTLCKAIGISDPPATIPECEVVVRQTHVNIVDLIQWGRCGGESGSIKVFETIKDLRDYTMSQEKIFPLENVENDKGETNIVLRLC